MQRRLAAILAADAVGYSKMMGHDEAGTLSALSRVIDELIGPVIARHNGRIVKLMGDGILAEFASVVDALVCAMDWQAQMAQMAETGHDALKFRIGVNLGDIIIQDDDIFGNGVNIAARLEGLAEPGGICVSEDVYRQAKGKVEAGFVNMGERNLKNVDDPLRVYRILPGASADGIPGDEFATAIGLDFSVPDYPSIAVLPFTAMGADREEMFFADGVTEDIITALSKVNRLLVVARNSTFVYKDQAVDIRKVSRELGVRYVLEGSVRKAGGRVRVTAQLIDAATGLHVWAERYDRVLEDIFAVQDEIMREIVTAMDVQLREGEQHRVWASGTRNLEAWESVRLATDAALGGSADAQPRARQLLDRAIELDPGYAIAWAMRAWLHFTEADVGGGIGNAEQFDKAQAAAFHCGHRALELDPDCAEAYGILALTHLNAREHDKAIEMSEKAIALAPNNAEILGGVASAVMRKSGRPERGAELVKKAMRLSPFYRPGMLRALGNNYRMSGRLEEAVTCFRESINRESGYLAAYVNLASALGELGRLNEARETVREIFSLEPDFSVAAYMKGLSYRNPSDLERIEAGLKKAGLADKSPQGPSAEPLPDKPSIAVLPLTNMSGDPEQDYFSDGISEDIITELSRFRTLFVIARNSSFAFRGAGIDVTEVGKKLGAQYVVEGSVRRAGNRVRITAQLIEAETGNHIWAERYDRELADLFAVQDEVTQSIVAVLPGRVQENVANRASRKPTDNMTAYELLLKGKSLRDGLNAQDTASARVLYQKALELDPRYARVYMYLADTYVVDHWLGLADEDAPAQALEIARKGAALDNNDVYIQDQLGYAFLCAGLWEDADVQFEKTLAQIVNEAESMAWCGYGFLLLGRHEKARDVVLEAMRLDPLHPPALDWILGQIYFFTGQYGDVIKVLIGEALLNSLAHAFLVAAYAHAGREREAAAALSAFIKQRRTELASRDIPVASDTIGTLASAYRKMWRAEKDWQHLAEGLRLAGLPD